MNISDINTAILKMQDKIEDMCNTIGSIDPNIVQVLSTVKKLSSDLDSAELKLDKVEKNLDNVTNLIYPIGSIYVAVNDISPQTLFGGTWEQIKDKFLLASGTTHKLNSTGGNLTHSHNITPHSHKFDHYHNIQHTHGIDSHIHDLDENGYALIHHDNSYFWSNEIETEAWSSTAKLGSVTGATYNKSNNNGTALGGTTSGCENFESGDSSKTNSCSPNELYTDENEDIIIDGSSMPPYLAVNVWKRIA